MADQIDMATGEARQVSHTPGPWEIGGDDHNGQAIVRGEHIEIATCWHHCVGSVEKEMRANALLIAASPEMLATLDRYADTLCEGWCEKSPDCAHFDDCGGCEARRIAGKARGVCDQDRPRSNFTLHRADALPPLTDIVPELGDFLDGLGAHIETERKDK